MAMTERATDPGVKATFFLIALRYAEMAFAAERKRIGSTQMRNDQRRKESFELTLRGSVSARLRDLWKARNGEPDEPALNEIGAALDETSSHRNSEDSWFNAAKAILNL